MTRFRVYFLAIFVSLSCVCIVVVKGILSMTAASRRSVIPREAATPPVPQLLHIYRGSSTRPLFHDPRTQGECANLFGSAINWRKQDLLEGDHESLDVRTREDLRFGRTSPLQMPQMAGMLQCFAHNASEAAHALLFRQIPKSASSSVGSILRSLVKAGSNKEDGCNPERRKRQEGISGTHKFALKEALRKTAFTFVRHPFSRLVSGFHTILVGLTFHNIQSKPNERMRQMPFWQRYLTMNPRDNALNKTRLPSYFRFIGDPPLSPTALTEDQVRELFVLFVADILVQPPAWHEQQGADTQPNGMAGSIHHVFSQMYFLSLRSRNGPFCTLPNASRPRLCNPRVNFVGRVEVRY